MRILSLWLFTLSESVKTGKANISLIGIFRHSLVPFRHKIDIITTKNCLDVARVDHNIRQFYHFFGKLSENLRSLMPLTFASAEVLCNT